jgi:hypothetical protein
VDEEITNALQNRIVEMEDGSQVVVSAWVAVVEYITADGTQELCLLQDGSSPDWRLDGLLSGGANMLAEDYADWDDD